MKLQTLKSRAWNGDAVADFGELVQWEQRRRNRLLLTLALFVAACLAIGMTRDADDLRPAPRHAYIAPSDGLCRHLTPDCRALRQSTQVERVAIADLDLRGGGVRWQRLCTDCRRWVARHPALLNAAAEYDEWQTGERMAAGAF